MYLRQMILGIEFCHRHNIIHRDIKPENVLVRWLEVLLPLNVLTCLTYLLNFGSFGVLLSTVVV